MQTSPISNIINGLSAPAPNSKTARAEANAPSFNQVLTREVSGRRNDDAPRAQEGQAKAAQGPKNNESAKTEKQASSQPSEQAKEAQGSDAAAPTQANSDAAAAQASAEILALVANVAGLQSEEAASEGDEQQLTLGAGRKRGSPFSADHAAIGARANHGTQSKPDGTWAAQFDRGSAQRVEPGKADPAALSGNTTEDLDAAATPIPKADFGTTLKDANQLLAPMQAQAAAQAQASQAADKLAPRVGSQGWDQALGQKVVWMVAGEQQSASLTLNPPDLGPLKIVLQVSNAQATATFIAAQPEVRQALENAMPRLREMLDQAGIQLGQASVDSGSPEQQHASERQASRSGSSSGAVAGEPESAGTTTRLPATAAGRGLVDTFA